MKQTIYIPVKVEEAEWWNDGEGARVIYDRFKKETPTHKTMVASKFWSAYQTWLAYNLLREMASKKPVTISEDDIIDTFQEYSSQSIFDHNLMTENDFYKAITKLMKGEK